MTASPRSVEETAAYWAMRLCSPACTPADRAAFEAWRNEDAVHARSYARVERALAVVDRHVGSAELTALGDKVLHTAVSRRRHRMRRALTGIAAVVTLAVGLGGYLAWQADTGEVPLPVPQASYQTAVGERSTINLPDGSTVSLNTASRLNLDYSPTRRQVTLTAGQALFEVAKDNKRPFEVLAGDQRIVALGTAFDVRLDAETGVQVTLLEGRVSVDTVVEPTVATNAERRELVPGEQLVVKHNAPTVVAVADLERVTSWRDGRLVFRNDPLADAVREVNRYSNTQLFVQDDPRLHAVRISGVFKAGGTNSFVTALETVYPIAAQTVSDDRIALFWRE